MDRVLTSPRHADDVSTVPLTRQQHRLRLQRVLHPDSSAYNVAAALRFRGDLDAEALRRAWAAVVARHDALRSHLLFVDGDVRLQVDDAGVAPLRTLAADEQAADVEALAVEVASRLFPIGEPLVRAELVRLGPADHLLVVAADHLVFDGWSACVVVEELLDAYVQGPAAVAARTPAPTLAELRALDDTPDSAARRERALAYWAERLRGAPSFSLPADRKAPSARRQRARTARASLTTRVLDGVRALASATRTTQASVLFAAYACLLARLGEQHDLVVGVPVVDRQFRGTERAVGFLTTTLPVRVEAPPALTFRQAVAQVVRRIGEAYAHSHVAFNDIVTEVKPPREPGRNPLFSVWFNVLPTPRLRPVPGLQVADVTPPTLGALFDVGLYCTLGRDTASLTLVVDDDLFEPWRAEAILAALVRLLEQAVDAPDEPVGSHPLPAPQPAPPAVRPSTSPSLLARVEEVARRVPERLAVADSTREVTYRELVADARTVAWYLRSVGVEAGDVVAVSSARTESLPAAILGVIGAGATLLLLDRNTQPARLAEYAERVGAQLVLELDAEAPLRGESRDGWPADGCEPTSYITVTSGSTGAPHAVRARFDAVANFVDWHVSTFGLDERDHFALVSGIGHDPVFRDVFTPLTLGATLLVPDRLDGAPHELLEWLRTQRISVLHATPPVVRLLAAAAVADATLPDLAHVFFGGDVLTAADVARARALAPHARLVNFYGTTETPQAVSCYVVPDAGELPLRVPIGPGVAGSELVVLTPAGVRAGIGELGEIHVRSRFLSAGYVGEQELTAARFSPVDTDGLRSFATGDLGRPRPAGGIDFAGRRDRQHKVRGFRVECAEIERHLAAHPSVADAWATVLHDEAGEQVVAYVVAPDTAAPTAGDVRAFATGVLPDYMVPARVAIVPRLPTTSNGKIDVAPLLAAQAADTAAIAPGDGYAVEVVRRVWQQILGAPSVDIDANWFDLGGSSLTLIAAQQDLERRLEREIPLLLLFAHTTIRSLASALAGEAGEQQRARRTADRRRRADARRRRLEARRASG